MLVDRMETILSRYPVRTESKWEVQMLITKNNEAKRMLDELKRQGCGHEPCKGQHRPLFDSQHHDADA